MTSRFPDRRFAFDQSQYLRQLTQALAEGRRGDAEPPGSLSLDPSAMSCRVAAGFIS